MILWNTLRRLNQVMTAYLCVNLSVNHSHETTDQPATDNKIDESDQAIFELGERCYKSQVIALVIPGGTYLRS